jgi:hypothetical protein
VFDYKAHPLFDVSRGVLDDDGVDVYIGFEKEAGQFSQFTGDIFEKQRDLGSHHGGFAPLYGLIHRHPLFRVTHAAIYRHH